MSFLKNAIELIGIIGFGTILAVIHIIINYCSKSIFSKMFAINVLGDVSEKRNISRLLKHYIPHRFRCVYNSDSAELSFKKFKQALQNKKYIVIVGSAGIGKSALMTKLAFLYKKRYSQKPKTLEDFSIIYYKINRGMTIDKIVEHIAKKLESNKNATIFIDGFDELNCLEGSTSYNQLKSLIDGLEREDVDNNCEKLIISTRKEIFTDGINSIDDIVFGNSSPAIFEILPFTENQAKDYFKRFFHGTQKKKKYKVLKSVLENNSDSVFQYPFILQFVDDIIETQNPTEIEIMDLYTALNTIVKKGLQRECGIYNKFIGEKSQRINIENYVTSGTSFLNYAARFMLESDNMCDYITRAELEIYENSAEGNAVYLSSLLRDNNISTTRRLLKYNDTKKAYEFIHSMLYEYFIAHAILCGEYTREERKAYIDKLSSSRTLIPEFYCKAVVELYRPSINVDEMPSVSEWDIRKIDSIQYVPQNITVESVLRVFPYAETICIDGKIVLDDEEFEYLLYAHTLKLSDRNTIDLAYLKCFETKTIYYLELADDSLININEINTCVNLKELIVSIDSLKTFEQLNKLPTSLHIYVYNILDEIVDVGIKLYETAINKETECHRFHLLHFPDIDNDIFDKLSTYAKYALICLETQTCMTFSANALKWGQSKVVKHTYFRVYSFLDDCFLDNNNFYLSLDNVDGILWKNFDMIERLIVTTLTDATYRAPEISAYEPMLLLFYYGCMLFLNKKYDQALSKLLEFVEIIENIRLLFLEMDKNGVESIIKDSSKLKAITMVGKLDTDYFLHGRHKLTSYPNGDKVVREYSHPTSEAEDLEIFVRGFCRDLFVEILVTYWSVANSYIAACYYFLGDYNNEERYYARGAKRKINVYDDDYQVVDTQEVLVSPISSEMQAFFDDIHRKSLQQLT